MNEAQTIPAVTFVPGMFCWWEVVTTDLTSAKAFYSNLFGWEYKENPISEDQVYVMYNIDGQDVGASYQLTKDMLEQGVHPHWSVYIATDDVDAATTKADELGGTIIMAPFDVFDVGRMSVIQDPTGAVFALWQAKAHPGAQRINSINAVCWNELLTRDASKAGAFYSGLFGYGLQTHDMGMGPYTTFMDGEAFRGGMMEMGEEFGEIPPHWMTYVQVEDCDTTVAKAQDLGAKVMYPANDLPEVGRFAVLQDPQGAVFSVITLLNANP